MYITAGIASLCEQVLKVVRAAKICYTLSGQKYLYTDKYPCTDCAIYRLKNQLGAKMGIEIHRY